MTHGPLESDTCRNVVLPALHAAGWRDEQIVEQYRLQNPEAVHVHRGPRGELRVADYVLELVPGLPVAVLEAKRAYRLAADGMQQALDYAERLDVPLSYATNGSDVIAHDRSEGLERNGAAFATPEEAWSTYLSWTGLDPASGESLKVPFDRTLRTSGGARVKVPRHYQRVAVHRVLRAIHGGATRVLLLMATGTGKTFTALQLVHKLRQYERLVRPDRPYRVLYLSDRDYLVERPRQDFLAVFGDAVTRLTTRDRTQSRDVYFATYQALDTIQSDEGDDGVPAAVFESYGALATAPGAQEEGDQLGVRQRL